MPERILISGGAGFIGSSLAIDLKARHPNWQIICLDNLRRRGSELNLPRLREAGITFVHGDIRASSDLDPKAIAVDTIIDCAAEPSVLAGFSTPEYVLHTNLIGTVNLLELARKRQAGLLFLSTSRVYSIPALTRLPLVEKATRLDLALNGQHKILGLSTQGIAESFSTGDHRSLYGTTKLASELLIAEYRQAYGLRAVIDRCSVVTGAWQMGKVDQGVFSLWIAAHTFGQPLKYIGYGGQGKQVRDLLDVRDLCNLVNYQLNHLHELDGEVFNVGGGPMLSLSLQETTQLCQQITGNAVPITSDLKTRPGDVPWFVTNCEKVTAMTGWRPQYDPAAVLIHLYQWLSGHADLLKPILFE